MKKSFLLLPLFTIFFPALAYASAFGLNGELELHFSGMSETQWSIIPKTGEPTTYALYGNTSFGPSVGPSFYFISRQNVFLGASFFYRQYEGKFQTPDVGTFSNTRFKDDEMLQFKDAIFLFRLGYIDYYRIAKWSFSDPDDALLAFPFGHARLGLAYSDISSTSAFSSFDPAYCLILGLEAGALYSFSNRFNLILSGIIDYNISLSPYTADYATESHEILINTLMFSLAFQFGVVSEGPR